MMKKKHSQCFNCHAYRHTLKECKFRVCIFCLQPNYRRSHHCNRGIVKNFGFTTIGAYQTYVRSLLVGEDYEAVLVRLQQERNVQLELFVPLQEEAQPIPVPQSSRGNYEQSAAAQMIPQQKVQIKFEAIKTETPFEVHGAAHASQHGQDQVVQEPQGTTPTTSIPYWKRDCYCTSFCSICSPSTTE
uniref:Uncharacterized protein n=1 Tax=Panagrolaimus sp. ES5 TaxID=591445 RepID=A0AC34GR22_9BILA